MTDLSSYPGQEPTAKFDREELVQGWRNYEPASPEFETRIRFSARTDMGQVRENNEDKFDFYEPEAPALLAQRGALYAVADGMGGAQAGQIASELLLKYLIAGYYNHPSPDAVTAMRDAIVEANERIHALARMIPERSGMGTTLAALVLVENRVVVAHVGDSRVYRVHNGSLEQMTCDHSWVEEQVRAGLMTRQEAEMSPFRNVITRSVGATPDVEPEFHTYPAVPGDIWLACSDGLTGHVEDEEIGRILMQNCPSEATRQLIMLANARGGRDNITVFALSIREVLPFAQNAMHEAPQQTREPADAPQTEPPKSGIRRLFGKA